MLCNFISLITRHAWTKNSMNYMFSVASFPLLRRCSSSYLTRAFSHTSRMTNPSNSIQVISPSTQELLFELPTLSQDQVDQAVQKSVVAFSEWKKIPVSKRVSIMEKFCLLFEQKKDKVAASITSQMGRPVRYGHGEVNGVLERANYMISVAEESLKDDIIEHIPGIIKRYQRKEPLGPIFLIAAWNYPYLTTVNNIIPALLAGNTVLLKQSPQTPQCADIFVETLREAGVPTDAVQAIHVQDKEANYLVQHPSIQFVNFTGSVAVGKKIRQAIGECQHLIGKLDTISCLYITQK